MRFLVFGASQRLGSYNRQLALATAALLEDARMIVDRAKYHEFMPPVFDDGAYERTELPGPAREFIERLERADGIVIACPEYNWSIPGALKNLIDWVSCVRPYPFAGKAVLLLSATPSRRGGMLGLSHLQVCLTGLEAAVYPKFYALGMAAEVFDKNEALKDKTLQAELEEITVGFVEFTRRLTG